MCKWVSPKNGCFSGSKFWQVGRHSVRSNGNAPGVITQLGWRVAVGAGVSGVPVHGGGGVGVAAAIVGVPLVAALGVGDAGTRVADAVGLAAAGEDGVAVAAGLADGVTTGVLLSESHPATATNTASVNPLRANRMARPPYPSPLSPQRHKGHKGRLPAERLVS